MFSFAAVWALRSLMQPGAVCEERWSRPARVTASECEGSCIVTLPYVDHSALRIDI